MKNITLDSKLADIWATPVGHDVIAKILLQMGISEKTVTRPLIRNLRLKTVMKLAKRTPLFGKDAKPDAADNLAKALVRVINSDPDEVIPRDDDPTPAWWKEAVFYQIYPRSFRDADGDGIGDIRGMIEKLDYLKDLGINALWLSPIYDSPQDDNGYDIRDYRKIDPMFGTMEDFDELLAGIHERGMHLIMDLVVNHTSDEHEWFQKGLNDPQSKYRNYYFFRDADMTDPSDREANAGNDTVVLQSSASLKPPNNWQSFFDTTGAWNYYPEQKVWALHLFSKKQMDLNWDNDELRSDVIDMIRFWLEKGVDGFRMDVINYISKEPGLPDGDPTIGALMNFTGIERYFYGPRMHEYFRQIRKEAFDPYSAFSVGETPGFGMKMAQLATAEERHELDMVFSFDHLETPGHVRYDDYKYDLNYLRDYMTDWMQNYGSQCWMSLFYNNHDNPRMASKVDPAVSKDSQLRRRIQTLLAVLQFTLRGTPFVYQGDEIGLVNYEFEGIHELSDVEVLEFYRNFLETMTPEEAWEKALCGTRDHARVLLPWNELPKGREHLKQEPDPEITELYRRLIALRAASPALIYGKFRLIDASKDHFTFERSIREGSAALKNIEPSASGDTESAASKDTGSHASEKYIIECNLCESPVKSNMERFGKSDMKLVFSTETGFVSDPDKAGTNTETIINKKTLAPYEARIWK